MLFVRQGRSCLWLVSVPFIGEMQSFPGSCSWGGCGLQPLPERAAEGARRTIVGHGGSAGPGVVVRLSVTLGRDAALRHLVEEFEGVLLRPPAVLADGHGKALFTDAAARV